MHLHTPGGNCIPLVRAVLAFCMTIAATFAQAADGQISSSSGVAMVTGPALRQGDMVMIGNASLMHDVESRPPSRNFRTIQFGTPDNTGTHAKGAHAGAPHALRVNVRVSGNVHVAKAVGRNALTVAEIYSRRAQFTDRVVQVRGRVVKFNSDIMGMNWVHLRDGSGSVLEGNNEIVVTTEQEVAIGEDVTAVGIVRTDVDFGSGYSYQVLIDDATFK